MLNTNLFNMASYTVVRKDRDNQIAPGGGVAILIKKHLVLDEVSVSNLVDHEAQECVWCGVRNGRGKDLVLGTIYRTPSSAEDNNDLICDLLRLSEDSTRDKQLLVCGGFNFRSIVWEENRVVNGSQDYRQAVNFLEAVNNNFWTQNVGEWTYLRETDNPSRLDLIFAKTDCEVEDIRYLAPLGFSKHAVICFTLAADCKPTVEEKDSSKLNYYKADLIKMRTLFRQEDWDDTLSNKSMNDK